LAKIGGCVPGEAAIEGWSMEIRSASRDETSTRVEIAVTATGEAVDFDLPVYRLSRGRWLINKSGQFGRAYLVDPTCREYKLKDRKAAPGREIPLDGRVRVTPGQPFEATLLFPRLPEETGVGMLVYNGQKLPFAIGVERR
jgi:hypothetical protein